MPDLSELYLSHAFWVWMAFAAALLAIEVATGSGWLLPSSASAAAVAILAVFTGIPLPVALLVFALLSIATTLLFLVFGFTAGFRGVLRAVRREDKEATRG